MKDEPIPRIRREFLALTPEEQAAHQRKIREELIAAGVIRPAVKAEITEEKL